MTLKKKSTPFTNGRCSDPASIKQRSKPTAISRKQDPSLSQGYIHTGMASSGVGPSKVAGEEKMYCNDPAQVQQWAADSAAEAASFQDIIPQELYSTSYGDAPLMTRTSSQPLGSFPMSRSPGSCFPVQQPVLEYAQGMDHNGLCNTDPTTGLETALNLPLPQVPEYGGHIDFSSTQCLPDAWSYSAPPTDSPMYANYTPMPDAILDAQGNVNLQPTWPQISCSAGEELLNASVAYPSNLLSGSPVSAVDPSVSSSYSQNSFVGPEPDTPISQAIQDGKWSPDLETGCFQGFSLSDPMHFSTPLEYSDQFTDGQRLVHHCVTLCRL